MVAHTFRRLSRRGNVMKLFLKPRNICKLWKFLQLWSPTNPTYKGMNLTFMMESNHCHRGNSSMHEPEGCSRIHESFRNSATTISSTQRTAMTLPSWTKACLQNPYGQKKVRPDVWRDLAGEVTQPSATTSRNMPWPVFIEITKIVCRQSTIKLFHI